MFGLLQWLVVEDKDADHTGASSSPLPMFIDLVLREFVIRRRECPVSRGLFKRSASLILEQPQQI